MVGLPPLSESIPGPGVGMVRFRGCPTQTAPYRNVRRNAHSPTRACIENNSNGPRDDRRSGLYQLPVFGGTERMDPGNAPGTRSAIKLNRGGANGTAPLNLLRAYSPGDRDATSVPTGRRRAWFCTGQRRSVTVHERTYGPFFAPGRRKSRTTVAPLRPPLPTSRSA